MITLIMPSIMPPVDAFRHRGTYGLADQKIRSNTPMTTSRPMMKMIATIQPMTLSICAS
jgi:hypothetical protein